MEQLVVVAENQIGYLASVLSILSENGINVRSISTERGNLSEIRLIVDEPHQAKKILEENDYTSHVVEIVVVELQDNPGELARIAKILEKNQVNIDYIYGIDNGVKDKGLFAIKTSLRVSELKDILDEISIL